MHASCPPLVYVPCAFSSEGGEIPQNRQEAFLLAFFAVLNFLFGLGSGIDNWAHLGGTTQTAHTGGGRALRSPPHVHAGCSLVWLPQSRAGLIGGLFLGIAMPPHIVKRPLENLVRIAAGVGFALLALLFILLIWVGHPAPYLEDQTSCF